MVRYIDIDGTICTTKGTDYVNAKPLREAIAVVNRWYDEGDVIVYWTARGMGPSNDTESRVRIRMLTTDRLSAWGCKYHELRMDKPVFDELVDDKAVSNVFESREREDDQTYNIRP